MHSLRTQCAGNVFYAPAPFSRHWMCFSGICFTLLLRNEEKLVEYKHVRKTLYIE